MATWEQIRASWSPAWRELYHDARAEYDDAIRANPERFRGKVRAFINALEETRQLLDAMAPHLAGHADLARVHKQLNHRYNVLAAGLYADAQAEDAPIGVAPLVVGLVVLGLVVGIGAIAWAVAANNYAVNLREQTALAGEELQARIDASEDGRVLQPTTLPMPDKKGKLPTWLAVTGVVLLGGLAVTPFVLGGKSPP